MQYSGEHYFLIYHCGKGHILYLNWFEFTALLFSSYVTLSLSLNFLICKMELKCIRRRLLRELDETVPKEGLMHVLSHPQSLVHRTHLIANNSSHYYQYHESELDTNRGELQSHWHCHTDSSLTVSNVSLFSYCFYMIIKDLYKMII